MATEQPDYKATLNLPKTAFAMKANLPAREPECLSRWQAEDLYGQIRRARATRPVFVLHDGPPYANGDIHIGHALNKILKDIVVRYKTMRGFDAPYIPGWDCHGMPIEHQLFKELGKTKHQIDQISFRSKARAYAERYVGIQREQFKRLGVLGDWDHPYLTMAQDYELTILRVFRELLQAGAIYRGRKPVYWCATCETALAEAEVEYEDRTDTSVYVKLEVSSDSKQRVAPREPTRRLFFIIWTTTPWTLPANVAVALHPQAFYRVVPVGTDEAWIAAEALWSSNPLLAKAQAAGHAGWTMRGEELAGLSYQQPFSSQAGVAVSDEFVSMTEGTGIVHIAPGHGQEDYAIGQRAKLDVLSPVDHQGRFTKDAPQFAGQSVFEANPKIVDDLRRRGLLLGEELITHAYPHCWRCKQPVIFRATPQWFLQVSDTLRQELLQQARTVEWIPPTGLSRMSGMLETRPDWCLSRQRYWGTPIPVLHCVRCKEPLLDARIIQQVEDTLRAKGMDAWFSATPQELAPGAACPTCRGRELEKETDILDVWFDSGVSHEAVLKPRQLPWPASLYLEGSDQHRGWFQVSLIPSVALHHQPPYRQVLTHGFVMDGDGRKMSKSLGNVIAPQQVMERYGADILRLWVASTDYREDVRISDAILEQIAEAYRKIRNTLRYLLANLNDYDPRRHPLEAGGLELDRWALHRLQSLGRQITEAYEGHRFHEAFRAAYEFCVSDLSAFYLDALKDRLYTEATDGPKRRCAQTVLYAILSNLTRWLAPVLAVTAEEVWQLMREQRLVEEPSVHLALWPDLSASADDPQLARRWDTFLALREAVMKALEVERGKQVIHSPLEARVTLVVSDAALRQLCEAHRQTLAEAFVVSEVQVSQDGEPSPLAGGGDVPGLVAVQVEQAAGQKCRRCWKHLPSVGSDAAHPQLCDRCASVVRGRR